MTEPAKEITRERRFQILQILCDETKCANCGQTKRKKMSHCSRCYYALPVEMRRALYNGFGDGYEEAFEASLEYLKKQTERKEPPK